MKVFASRTRGLFQCLSSRGIYIKDKTLDKSAYKPSELDQLDVYMKNYMSDDPKGQAEAQRLAELLKYQQQE